MAMREPSAGELNRRVLVRRRIDYPDPQAGLESGFSDQRHRWAMIEPVGTAVYAAAAQTDNRITHRVILRHLPGITEEYEVVHAATVYRVRRGAALNGGNRFTVLEVEQL